MAVGFCAVAIGACLWLIADLREKHTALELFTLRRLDALTAAENQRRSI